MSKSGISIKGSPDSSLLEPRLTDRVSTVARATIPPILSQLCDIGPLGELIAGSVVSMMLPERRQERIAQFAHELHHHVERLSEIALSSVLSNQAFLNVLEDGARQAAMALSETRVRHIACLVSQGISEEQQRLESCQKLLATLHSLSDIEIIALYSLNHSAIPAPPSLAKHRAIFLRPPTRVGFPEEDLEREAIFEARIRTLVTQGLITEQIRVSPKDGHPEFNTHTRRFETQSVQITPLGRLLLKYIDAESMYGTESN